MRESSGQNPEQNVRQINGLERRERKISKKKGKQFQQTILDLHVVEKERTQLETKVVV